MLILATVEQDTRVVAVPTGVCLIKVRESVTRRANDRCCAFVRGVSGVRGSKLKSFEQRDVAMGEFSSGNSFRWKFRCVGQLRCKFRSLPPARPKFHEPTKRNVR